MSITIHDMSLGDTGQLWTTRASYQCALEMQLENGGPARHFRPHQPRETYRRSLLFGGNQTSQVA